MYNTYIVSKGTFNSDLCMCVKAQIYGKHKFSEILSVVRH